eukprot:705167-Rhodomonas_salina.1
MSESAIACRVSDWSGQSRAITMTVGTRSGTTTEMMSFDAATISSVMGNQGSDGAQVVVTVIGHAMGVLGQTARTRVGVTGCESSTWMSDTQVECLPVAGIGGTSRMTLTVGQLTGSVSEAITYGLA